MNFTLKEMEANTQHLSNAKHLADTISKDLSVGGIFPNAAEGDFQTINPERFKNKFCSWWPLAKKLLALAKIFTGEKVDRIIDRLIEVGDNLCVA